MPTTATLTGPVSGALGAESADFTVRLDAPAPAGGVLVLLSSTGADDVLEVVAAGPPTGS